MNQTKPDPKEAIDATRLEILNSFEPLFDALVALVDRALRVIKTAAATVASNVAFTFGVSLITFGLWFVHWSIFWFLWGARVVGLKGERLKGSIDWLNAAATAQIASSRESWSILFGIAPTP